MRRIVVAASAERDRPYVVHFTMDDGEAVVLRRVSQNRLSLIVGKTEICIETPADHQHVNFRIVSTEMPEGAK